MSKCRGKLCVKCEPEYCMKALDMFDEDIDFFECEESVVGLYVVDGWCVDDYGKKRDMRMFDWWEGSWR
jgi:hypothetical protein